MKKLAALMAVLVFASNLVHGQDDATDSSGTPLFDGKSFDGWEGNLDAFRIQDNAIVGGSLTKQVPRNEYLCTKREYADFELRLKFEVLGQNPNAGIQIRSERVPNSNEMIGYQADIGQVYWGSLYDERRHRLLTGPPVEKQSELYEKDDWNEYVIRCEGRRVRLWLNGQCTVDYTEPDSTIPQTGVIGLQIHKGAPSEAWYKDITLKELPADKSWSGETVRVAGIVLKWLRADKESNYRRAEAMIRRAAKDGAKIVCTTECFLDGYAIKDKTIPLEKYRALGEKIPAGPFCRRLAALADELDIFLVAGMLEADGEYRYNTAVLIAPDGRLVGKYRKQQLGHELVRNTPGASSPVFETPYGKMAIMICADRRYPDLVKRLCDGGADLLICPSGGMFGPKSNDPFLQARSKENNIWITFVHPAEFLITNPAGDISFRTILGDRLEITPEQIKGEHDKNEVFFFDLPLTGRSASVRAAAPDG